MAVSVERAPRTSTTRTRAVRARRPSTRRIQWLFIGPAAALFLLFFAYPLFASLYQSLEA